ncbi:LppP/LprE family lipoprotein [Corynebacterium auriscanis]|uniref:LppP/LprE family lipoprotein n=1 Tax=Corynebacterium auriscanis TaxID=99807 RepID=UPI000689B6C4|nr:LppP/LprE family lipoprotein [Corynebacterium auriscanis]WJY71949.1 hypothetical protein CAURIC_01355 [Corynebacterium auriscanis]
MKRIATLIVAAGLVISGCSTMENETASSQKEQPETTPSVEATPQTPSKDQPSPTLTSKRELPPNVRTSRDRESEHSRKLPSAQCGSDSATQAVRDNISRVKPNTWDWDASTADIDGYDPCAPLSWITVTIHGATSSSPFQIMLFNYGEYLGTTTSEAYGFMPTVTRAGDDALNVVYHYPLPGESNAERSGEAHASFRWSESAGRIIMTGNVPPQ